MIKHLSKLIYTTSLICMIFLFSCGDDSNPINPNNLNGKKPEIKKIDPTEGYTGSVITISGKYFGVDRGNNYVLFGTLKPAEADYVFWNDSTILVKIPEQVVSGLVKVVRDSIESNKIYFTIKSNNDSPFLSTVNPSIAYPGYEITITGKNFLEERDTNYLELHGSKLGEFQYVSWSDTKIVFKVPSVANYGSGKLKVNVAGKNSNEVNFEIKMPVGTEKPEIDYLDVEKPFPRDQIGIIGSNFGISQGACYVTFSGIKAIDYISWKDNKIVVLVPTGATSGDVIVHVDGLVSEPVFLSIQEDNILLDQSLIPAGSFMMGADDEPAAYNSPKHQVIITKAFYMSNYEINQEVWSKVAQSITDYSLHNDDPQKPVDRVSWINACKFCNLLSLRERFDPVYTINGDEVTANLNANGYRLPTEAEWEWAALGGGLPKFGLDDSGNTGDANSMGWNNDNSDNNTHPVGKKKSNKYGLYDMFGNVTEWCWDWYEADYDATKPVDPVGPGKTDDLQKVLRGGSYTDDELKTTVSYRWSNRYDGFQSEFYIGFRVVRNGK